MEIHHETDFVHVETIDKYFFVTIGLITILISIYMVETPNDFM